MNLVGLTNELGKFLFFAQYVCFEDLLRGIGYQKMTISIPKYQNCLMQASQYECSFFETRFFLEIGYCPSRPDKYKF